MLRYCEVQEIEIDTRAEKRVAGYFEQMNGVCEVHGQIRACGRRTQMTHREAQIPADKSNYHNLTGGSLVFFQCHPCAILDNPPPHSPK